MGSLKVIAIIGGFVLFFASAFLLFEPGNDPTGFFVYTPSLAVFNYDNNEGVGENLEVEFITKGEEDLRIISLSGEVEFVRLKCGDRALNPSVDGNIMEYKNYNCKENGKAAVRILSQNAEIEFKFGNDRQIVKNTVS